MPLSPGRHQIRGRGWVGVDAGSANATPRASNAAVAAAVRSKGAAGRSRARRAGIRWAATFATCAALRGSTAAVAGAGTPA
eukprot:2471397-Alexandrium_andersonii.AAC.1